LKEQGSRRAKSDAKQFNIGRRVLVPREAFLAAVSVADLAAFADTFADLADPEVIDHAWR